MVIRHIQYTFLAGLVFLAGCAANAAYQQAQLSMLMGGTPRPETAEGYSAFLVARYAALTNDPRQALEGYERALTLESGKPDLAERAVFAALMAGTFEDAVRLAKKVDVSEGEASSLVRLTLAVDAVREGRLAAAEAALAASGGGAFDQSVMTPLRAWIAYQRGGIDAGGAKLFAQENTTPLHYAAEHYFLALMYLAEGADEEALNVLSAVWETGPRLAVAAEAQARLLAQSGREQQALDVLTTFRRDIGPNPAIDGLRRQIESGEPVSIDRPSLRSGAALALYTPGAALAAQTDSDFPGVLFALTLALDPDMDIARTLWAKSLDGVGRRGEAIEVLEVIAPDSPYYATARGQLAWAYRRDGQGDRALQVASEAIDATSDRDLMVQMGDLLTTLRRDGEANQLFTRVIGTDRANGEADWRLFLARGAARERLGRWPEAEADLREAMRLSPDNPRILNHLGYSLVDRGIQLDEGLRLISRAVDLRPRSGMILDSLGWAYFRLGDYSRAVIHLERAVELEPGDPVINDHLGDAYWRTGRRLEARFQWQRALTLEPEPNLVSQLHLKLREGLDGPTARVAAHGGDATDRQVHP
ncbi:MAG: tetratricopeptide repeat protein [Pseudomonadota bacterium]